MVISQFRNKDVQEKLEGQYLRARNISTLKTCSKLFDALFLAMLLHSSEVWEHVSTSTQEMGKDPITKLGILARSRFHFE